MVVRGRGKISSILQQPVGSAESGAIIRLKRIPELGQHFRQEQFPMAMSRAHKAWGHEVDEHHSVHRPQTVLIDSGASDLMGLSRKPAGGCWIFRTVRLRQEPELKPSGVTRTCKPP